MNPRLGRHPAVLIGICAVYAVLGRGANMLTGLGPDQVPAVWPASGFALTVLVVFGLGAWPAVLAGAVSSHVFQSGSLASSLVLAGAQTLESVAAAALISRVAGGLHVLRATGSSVRALGIVAATGLIPAVAAAAMRTPVEYATSWWLASVTGTLVVAPGLLFWTTTPVHKPRREQWPAVVEAGALAAASGLVCWLVFGSALSPDVRAYPVELLLLPLFLWSALRFGPRGVTSLTAFAAVVAMIGTSRGVGPFIRGTAVSTFVVAHAYTAAAAVLAVIFSVTLEARTRAEAQLQTLATTDPLTGLANYRRLLDVMRQEIMRSRRTGRQFAVLLVDIDGLRTINDRHGHLAGSRAVSRLAETIRRTCRETDTPARVGGDDFAIILAETGDEGGRAVLQRLSQRLASDPAKPALSITGGHAVFPRDGDSATLLLRAADRMLSEAKELTHLGVKNTATGELVNW